MQENRNKDKDLCKIAKKIKEFLTETKKDHVKLYYLQIILFSSYQINIKLCQFDENFLGASSIRKLWQFIRDQCTHSQNIFGAYESET